MQHPPAEARCAARSKALRRADVPHKGEWPIVAFQGAWTTTLIIVINRLGHVRSSSGRPAEYLAVARHAPRGAADVQ